MKTKILFLFFIIFIKGNLLLEACQDNPPGILFLGQTGVGKSASINLLYNLLTGVKVEEERKFITSLYNGERWIEPNVSGFQAHKKKPSQESQTEDVLKVPVPDGKGCIKAVLWDTPGALDTSLDPYVDKANWGKILGAIWNNPIHLIVIVMKPQDMGRNNLDILATKSFYKTLAKKYQDRIVGLFTHSSSITDETQKHLIFQFQEDYGSSRVFFLDNKILLTERVSRYIWDDAREEATALVMESESFSQNFERLNSLVFLASFDKHVRERYEDYLKSNLSYLTKQKTLSNSQELAKNNIVKYLYKPPEVKSNGYGGILPEGFRMGNVDLGDFGGFGSFNLNLGDLGGLGGFNLNLGGF